MCRMVSLRRTPFITDKRAYLVFKASPRTTFTGKVATGCLSAEVLKFFECSSAQVFKCSSAHVLKWCGMAVDCLSVAKDCVEDEIGNVGSMGGEVA